jgi:hypothetical protein
MTGNDWSAFQAYISGWQLHTLYSTYGDELFSANPRRFLGVGKKTNIINHGIKESAEKDPCSFWAYNNGITALVHDYDCSDHEKLVINGISIINGAQTTGTIGNLTSPPSGDLLVSLRVIKCSNPKTIEAIIANNNRQNEMVPSDFRSNDVYQTRLREEFENYPQFYYNGGQRNDSRPRGREVFNPDTVAQSLLAFNGNPVGAYSSKKEIWNNDAVYSSVFNDDLSAEHIIYVYSLGKTIDDIKLGLQQKANDKSILDVECNQLEFLCKRGSRILLLSSIAKCLETILQRQVIVPSRLHFSDSTDFSKCKEWWKSCVVAVLPFHASLAPALSAGGLDSKAKADEAMKSIEAQINAIISILAPQLQDLRQCTKP